MVTAADIKLLPYFNDNFPVRPRFQRPGSTSQPVPRKAFDKARALHQYKLNPTRIVDHSAKKNNALHTHNAKRQVELRTIHPAVRLGQGVFFCRQDAESLANRLRKRQLPLNLLPAGNNILCPTKKPSCFCLARRQSPFAI